MYVDHVLYWIMLVSGKLKFEAILGKFIFGCGSTDQTKWRPLVRKIKKKV